MSAWIAGSQIVADLGLLDFEFLQEYAFKGLIPHNHEGQPYMPAAVVFQIIAGLGEELAQHEDVAWNLGGYEREEIIANRIQPLQQRIQSYQGYLESLNGSSWEGFVLPQDPELSARFIGALLNSYYHRDEVYKRLSPQSVLAPDQKPVRPAQIAEQVQAAVKQRKQRPDQKHRLACREAAEKIWKEDPSLTIEDMIDQKEITDACQGAAYIRKTIRSWINDLYPNRKPGRRKEKLF